MGMLQRLIGWLFVATAWRIETWIVLLGMHGVGIIERWLRRTAPDKYPSIHFFESLPF
jgi:hypothetical protein